MERLTNSDKEIPTLVNNAEYWLEVYFKLKDIEDAEEQGLLLRLPCKVGTIIYKGVMFKIKCMKCGTEFPKSYECEMYMDQDGGIRTGKDERTKAITDWNRRANDENTD